MTIIICLKKRKNGKTNNDFFISDVLIEIRSFTIYVYEKKASSYNSISIVEKEKNQTNFEVFSSAKTTFTFSKKDKIPTDIIISLPLELIHICKSIAIYDFSNQKNLDKIQMEIPKIELINKENLILINIDILEAIKSDLCDLLNDDKALEKHFQKWISKNSWIFGNVLKIDGEKVSKGLNENISEFDFTYSTLFSISQSVLEIKKTKAQTNIILYDSSHKSWYWSKEVTQAIGQITTYLDKQSQNPFENINKNFKKRVSFSINGLIIIGRSNKWNHQLFGELDLLNSSLKNIQVITYDHLVNYIEDFINLIKKIKGETSNHL